MIYLQIFCIKVFLTPLFSPSSLLECDFSVLQVIKPVAQIATPLTGIASNEIRMKRIMNIKAKTKGNRTVQQNRVTVK